jgi:transcriptional regulator with XRE-family HTH domain
MPRGISPQRKAGPVDLVVGGNMRSLRILRGLSQEALAGRLGLTFQQVQKYETGTNRISVGRLLQLAERLDCSLDDLLRGATNGTRRRQCHDEATDRAVLELNRVVRGLSIEHVRAIHRVARALAETAEAAR